MIVLGEQQEGVTIIHVVLGEETEFQFNLSGHSIMDITEYVSKIKSGDKCMIVINRCDSEDELIEQLNYHRNRIKAASIMAEAEKQMTAAPDESVKGNTTPQHTDDKPTCPKCKGPRSANVINGKIYPCDTCKKIDEGLKHIPPVP